MTFPPQPGSELPLSPYPSLSGSEIAALKKLRLILITEIAIAADRIARIDNRLHNLRIYEEMDRPGETGKETAEAAAASAKEEGEA